MPKLVAPDEKRVETISLRLTRAERAEAEALARANGQTLTELIRTLLAERVAREGRKGR